jgi:hypothetical protein
MIFINNNQNVNPKWQKTIVPFVARQERVYFSARSGTPQCPRNQRL